MPLPPAGSGAERSDFVTSSYSATRPGKRSGFSDRIFFGPVLRRGGSRPSATAEETEAEEDEEEEAEEDEEAEEEGGALSWERLPKTSTPLWSSLLMASASEGWVCVVRVGECVWESEREKRESKRGSKRVRLVEGGERVRTVGAQNTKGASGGQPALPRQAHTVVHASPCVV